MKDGLDLFERYRTEDCLEFVMEAWDLLDEYVAYRAFGKGRNEDPPLESRKQEWTTTALRLGKLGQRIRGLMDYRLDGEWSLALTVEAEPVAFGIQFPSESMGWTFWNMGRELTSYAVSEEDADEILKDHSTYRKVPLYTSPPAYREACDCEKPGAYHSRLAQIDALKATRAHDKLKIDGLEAKVGAYREALERIAEMRESCVYSMSRAGDDGNEAFMEGSNTAFGQAADIADEALGKEEKGD
jgi:hypothetical protein